MDMSSEELAGKARIDILRMINRAGAAHIGSAFSAVDILAVLYSGILNVNSSEPMMPERDRFVLSKGHAGSALYAILARRGFFDPSKLDHYSLDGSNLSGHVSSVGVSGVEVSTGSLGHGSSISAGMAYGAKLDAGSFRVFCLISDGECDEGPVWEAALFAAHHKLDNLVVIIDYNKIQSFGAVRDVLDLEPLADKWRSFGFEAREVDGHNHGDLTRVFGKVPWRSDKPNCLIAHTVKGKGVSFMENKLEWHYNQMNKEQFEKALEEIKKL